MKKFDNFSSNLEVLKRAGQEDIDNEFIISGIIDKFFIQFELSWKVLKELLRYEGSREGKIGIAQRDTEGSVLCVRFY